MIQVPISKSEHEILKKEAAREKITITELVKKMIVDRGKYGAQD
jgi:predicted HicB family RNase H-like nuclease